MKFFILFALLFAPVTLLASHCGAGLAAEDLAGNCRVAPFTPGALEVTRAPTLPTTPTPPPATVPAPTPAPKPAATQTITLPAIWSADIFSTGGRGVNNPWDHCAGRQGATICRVVLIFDTGKVPKGKTIVALKLKLSVPYVTAGLSATTWAVGGYGVPGNDPRADNDVIAYARAAIPAPYIKGSGLLRTVGVKTLLLTGTAAQTDLATVAKSGVPFAIAIKSNREKDVDRFTTIGRYNGPAKPEMIVTVKTVQP